MKFNKRKLALLMTGLMLVMSPVSVWADREDAKLEKPYVSLGADLSANDRAIVLKLLGVTEDDLKNYTVTTITNADEHKYLDSYLSKSVIGTRALSSVLVKVTEVELKLQPTTLLIVRPVCTRTPWQQQVLRMQRLW